MFVYSHDVDVALNIRVGMFFFYKGFGLRDLLGGRADGESRTFDAHSIAFSFGISKPSVPMCPTRTEL